MKIFSRLLFFLGLVSIFVGTAVTLNLVSASQISQAVNLTSPQPSPTPTPTPAAKITSAKIEQNCRLYVNTDQGTLDFATNFDPNVAKCAEYVLVDLDNAGQYTAFEDLAETGIDSLVKVFSYQLQKITLLHDLGKYSILDFAFLKSGQLAVLASDGLKGKQLVYVYDLDYLFSQYPQEASEGEFSDQAIKLATGELAVTGGTQRAAYLKISDQQLQVYAEGNDQPIQSFSLEVFN